MTREHHNLADASEQVFAGDRAGTRSFVPALFGPNDFGDVIVAIAFDDVFENDLAVDVLHMNPPSRDLRDVGSINRLLHAPHSVQSRLGELAMAMTLVVLKLCKRLEEFQFQLFVGKLLHRFVDDAILIEQRFQFGHRKTLIPR